MSTSLENALEDKAPQRGASPRSSLSRNIRLHEQRELGERLLPAEIAGFDWNHRRQVCLFDVDLGSDRNRFQGYGDLDDAGQIGIVETIGVADTLVGHDLQIFSAERMARVRGEIRKRHPECAANLRFKMVDLAGEAVGRQPLGHGIRIEEGAKNLFRL